MKLKLNYLFFTLIAVLFMTDLQAQGWAKTYDYEQYDSIHTLLKTPTGYLLVGETIVYVDMDGEVIWSTPLPGDLGDGGNRKAALLPDGSFVVLGHATNAELTLWKFTSDGILDWSYGYDFTPDINVGASSVAPANDGGFILLGRTWDRSRLIKTDQNGQIEWNREFIGSIGHSVVALADGGYAFTGYNSLGSGGGGFVKKTDNSGNELWEYDTSLSWSHNRASIIEVADGNLVSAMRNKLVKLNQSGSEIWSIDFSTNWPDVILANDLTENQDGVILTIFTNWAWPRTNHLSLISSNGQIIQTSPLASNLQNKQLLSIQKAHDTGWVVAGYYNPPVADWELDMLLVKTDDDLLVFSDTIHGNVFLDANLNCEQDTGELELHNGWSVKATGDLNFWATPDADGNYELVVSPGDYLVSVHSPYPSALWEACESPVNVQVEPNLPVELDFAMTGDSCPYMEVQVGNYNFRPCLNTSIVVSYSNHGLAAAEDAMVSIVLDSALAYVEATIPLTAQDGQTLWFDLGDVEVNGQGVFFVEVAVECDLDLVGETLCYTAHIYPDTTCGESFTGPNIEVNAICNGDSVHFTLSNVGGDMPDPMQYIVIEDNLIMISGDYQLAEDESLTVSIPATNGATQYLIAEQDDDLPPSFGNHIATSSIEGCVGAMNVGAFDQFPSDDGEHWLDISCMLVTNSYDPNDKSASPTGWTNDHFIDDRTEIEYLIRFQNTGTDTAFYVTLIDTLSTFLDPGTIRPGPSSHPYRFVLSGQGVAKFIFEDIMLPDSNVNETLSHGFVKFHIAQQAGNQPGDVIENTAGIYFDYNAPVYTNTIFHTIVDDWIEFVDATKAVGAQSLNLSIYPNPMEDWAIFEAGNLLPNENMLLLTDATGRVVSRQPFFQDKAILQRGSLTPGLYFFKIENDGRCLGSGKLVVR